MIASLTGISWTGAFVLCIFIIACAAVLWKFIRIPQNLMRWPTLLFACAILVACATKSDPNLCSEPVYSVVVKKTEKSIGLLTIVGGRVPVILYFPQYEVTLANGLTQNVNKAQWDAAKVGDKFAYTYKLVPCDNVKR